ncbi:MAG: hypothetical protein ABI972_06780 [Acidobacteriota bacterium]
MKLMQQRARDLRAKTRRESLKTLAGPFAIGLFYAVGLKEFAALRQMLQPPFALAIAWSLAGLYFLNRGMWSTMVPAEAGLITSLQSCRREIERQRDLVRRALMWSFGPVLLTLGAFILALVMVGTKERGIFPNGLPFLVLVLIWMVAYFTVRLREQRDLQREIEELNCIEQDSPVL